MTVKTYSASSMQAAMAQVKQDIGEDALIISTRRIPKPPMDPYGKDTFQIEASAARQAAKPANRKKNTVRNRDLRNLVAELDRPALDARPIRDTRNIQQGGLDFKDVRDILFWTGFNDDVLELMEGHKDAFRVYSKLLMSGLSEKRVKVLLKKGMDREDTTEEDFTLNVLKHLIGSVEAFDPFVGDGKTNKPVRVAAFIGPTGVGKTTTIAKLAAELCLKRKKRVGLVSVDNYRIGAVDQLKTYASIIGLPCIPAFTAEDLNNALKKLSSMDVILIDTAGQSHLDTKRMTQLKTILCSIPQVTRHLVISAAMGRLDMKEVVDHFDLLSPSSYVFSKVDETRRCGRIVDQMMDRHMPLSFITNGQEVPEDLIVASPKYVLQLLLNPETFRS